MRPILLRRLRTAAGVLTGCLTALVELPLVALCGLWLLATWPWQAAAGGAPRATRVPYGAAARLTAAERTRMTYFYGSELAPPRPSPRALQYLALRWGVGVLGGAVLLTALIGALYGSTLLWIWFVARDADPFMLVAAGLAGLFLLFLSVQGVDGVAALDNHLAHRFLGPSPADLLQRRIGELAATRAGVVAAVHDERRRIERDLHDGVQQRLVVLGMLLGRARRTAAADPAKSRELLRQAHEQAQLTLTDLREVAWHVYPAALDDAGLRAALEALAERAELPVRIEYGLAEPLPEAVRTVAYFTVSEAVTNAIKHSSATLVTVRLTRDATMARVSIEDDGAGGANPSGGGLLGLARRVAALDGRLTVASPPGGPTTVTAELPCA
ncbi:sensor histidine kinase [Streptomyces sp. MAR4 CNX-425]|uniref:sensor histidine kinase n=1 Tax=Streptomyces sp. MAR4 CNX-425 TaxID=3406343 RepID=UPI003B508153